MIINNISVPHNTCREKTILKLSNDVPALTIGRGSYIVSASIQTGEPFNLQIGQFCSMATNITFMLHIGKDYSRVTTSADQLISPLSSVSLNDCHITKGEIIIQNDVWIGHNATIMSGVKVGNGAIIACDSHDVKDVPPYAIIGGNPAKIIKYRFTEKQITDLQNIAWWDWSDEIITERKSDFSLPIQKFIDKYKSTQCINNNNKDTDKKRILFFPDFDITYPLWKRVIGEYCNRCKEGIVLGQLFIYIPEDANTDRYIMELEEFLKDNYDESGDIYVQVGQITDIGELFASSDYYVTSKEHETVRHSCLADKFGVKLLSGTDSPVIFSKYQL